LIKKSHLWYEKDAEIQPGGETINIQHHTIQTLTAVVEKLPTCTNLALYQFLWLLISGALHDSRGVMFPTLKAIGAGWCQFAHVNVPGIHGKDDPAIRGHDVPLWDGCKSKKFFILEKC